MTSLPKQEYFLKHWQQDINHPLVSICCITYNHESYIEKALQSFLMQRTNFAFEILVHDDASTDNTTNIIRRFYEKYPQIIKPVFQNKNQYSKGYRVNPALNFPRAQGKYLAICEGDDYWVDSYKLQLQIDEMEKNPKIGISFHPSYELIDGQKGQLLSNYSDKSKIFNISEVILGDGGFCPTASTIYRKEAVQNLPEWFYKEAPVGDYFLQIFASESGGALFINKPMSVYRMLHSESSEYNKQKNKEIFKYFCDSIIISLEKLKVYFDHKYDYDINKIIAMHSNRAMKRSDLDLSFKKYIFNKTCKYFTIKRRLRAKLIFLYHKIYAKNM